MKVYQIYFLGEATDKYYKAYTEDETLEEYKEGCIESYKSNFGSEPDMSCFDWVEAIEVE